MPGSTDALQKMIAEDPALAARLAAIKDVERIIPELLAAAKARGLNVTEAELRESFAAKAGGAPQPLEDEALDSVAGAGSPWCFATRGCYCFATK